MGHTINTIDDLFEMLDSKVQGASFDWMYSQRPPVPFITQNELPDENLVEFISSSVYRKPQTALELGCGEGRNAIYLARNGIDVTAIDISEVAIRNAQDIADKKGVKTKFITGDVFKTPLGRYDFVYDSGLFHHLSPHRRLSYLKILNRTLAPGGYFGLACFAWGENCADEVDDYEFYNSSRAGVAFTEERLRELFEPLFHVISIRKYRNGVPDTIQGLQFMWVCLFEKR